MWVLPDQQERVYVYTFYTYTLYAYRTCQLQKVATLTLCRILGTQLNGNRPWKSILSIIFLIGRGRSFSTTSHEPYICRMPAKLKLKVWIFIYRRDCGRKGRTQQTVMGAFGQLCCPFKNTRTQFPCGLLSGQESRWPNGTTGQNIHLKLCLRRRRKKERGRTAGGGQHAGMDLEAGERHQAGHQHWQQHVSVQHDEPGGGHTAAAHLGRVARTGGWARGWLDPINFRFPRAIKSASSEPGFWKLVSVGTLTCIMMPECQPIQA